MACPLCNAAGDVVAVPYENAGVHSHPCFDELRLVGCKACRSSWVENPPSDRALGDYYAKAYTPGRMGPVVQDMWPHYDSRAVSLIALARLFLDLRPGGLFVDVGPGNGSALSLCPYLLPEPRLACIEHNQASIAYFRRHAPDIAVASDARDLTARFGQASASLVYSAHCYEHFSVESLREHLRDIRDLMAHDGVLAIEVPFAELSKIERAPFHTPHLIFFSEAGLRSLLRQSGFDVKLCVDVVGRSATRGFVGETLRLKPADKRLARMLQTINSGDFIHRAADPKDTQGFALKCIAVPAATV